MIRSAVCVTTKQQQHIRITEFVKSTTFSLATYHNLPSLFHLLTTKSFPSSINYQTCPLVQVVQVVQVEWVRVVQAELEAAQAVEVRAVARSNYFIDQLLHY
eukprot:Protomagalhaensia_wolfi_Nauph_80__4948@NODE_5219_length_423_cov_1124_171875_g4277_i0_p1_GENE_NODE_5219_length_423_cov_1124_171875_g4277_i0NODE_5219_length_423_cov_1124_171875_g4277_i0_p1_ORF_typecomplete_len102_score11_45TsaE/PF02367_17/0_52_NODE_5219_length_423_cov_1124_171875_g4277_i034339